MRYPVILLLVCALFFSSAQADGLTAHGVGAAMFCCKDGYIMMDSTWSTPWADIDDIYWDRLGNGQNWTGGDKATYATYAMSWDHGGKYYPQLKVVDTNPDPPEYDIDTSMGPFYVGEPKIAASTWGGRAPLYVAFDGSNSLPSELSQSYEWDFEWNGTFSTDATGATVNHTYSAGSYTVALRVTYGGNPAWVCTSYGQIDAT